MFSDMLSKCIIVQRIEGKCCYHSVPRQQPTASVSGVDGQGEVLNGRQARDLTARGKKWPPKSPCLGRGRPATCKASTPPPRVDELGYGTVSRRDASPRKCLRSPAISAWTLPLALLSILLAHAAPCIWPLVAGDDSRDAGSASKYATALAEPVTAPSMLH